MIDFTAERDEMIERQLVDRGIVERPIIEAFRAVPRELFVSEAQAPLAYGDHPLPIGAGQTISQPYIVALMIQAAAVAPGDHVLEVGSGSGYAAALLGRLAARVLGMERQHELAETSRERLEKLGYGNIAIVEGDGTLGWPDAAPFDAILVAASGSEVPEALTSQLRAGGRLVMPLGPAGSIQDLVRVEKLEDGTLRCDVLCSVRFVPLIGKQGWTGR